MSKAEVLKTLKDYKDAWDRGDVEAGTSYYAEDMVVHMGGGSKLSRDYTSRADFITNWVKRVEDYTDSWTFHGNELIMAGDDGVAMRIDEEWTRGDRSVMCKRLAIYRVVDGQMPECWFTEMNSGEVDAFFDEID
ncbi:MAG: nuclear transport factor 2 family protein [Actinobacteria bacterium]|nr:nuclear transport factor 2 family protein [Actinomycetota bacterium]